MFAIQRAEWIAYDAICEAETLAACADLDEFDQAAARVALQRARYFHREGRANIGAPAWSLQCFRRSFAEARWLTEGLRA